MEHTRPGLAVRPSLLAISKNKASSSALSISTATTPRVLDYNNVEHLDDDDHDAPAKAPGPLLRDGGDSPTSLDHASGSSRRDSQSILSTEEYAHVEPSTSTTMDPRTMLRQQLQRNAPSSSYHNPLPSRSRKSSYIGSISSVLSTPQSVKGLKAAESTSQDEVHSTQSHAEILSHRRRPNKRRYFVLTSAGKPVFASNLSWPDDLPDSEASRQSSIDKDDEEFTSLVGVIQAIISLYAVENDRIRYIDAGKLKIAFFLKNPIYLVAVSDWGEPESVLRTHLEYLYLQILSTTTASQLQNIFNRRSNFDLRRMLQGTEGMMNSLLDNFLPFDFQALLGSLTVFPVSSTLRGECSDILKKPPLSSKKGTSTSDSDILYAILVQKTTIITLLRHKTHSIHPSDLHISLNTIESTKDLQVANSENWLPICLPKFNSKGFVYAFISYFGEQGKEQDGAPSADSREGSSEDLKLGVILITSNKERFFDMQAWKEIIASRLFSPAASSGTPTSLYNRLSHDHVSHKSLQASLHDFAPRVTSIIRHWIYKSKAHVQVLQAPFHSGPSSRPTEEGGEESLYADLNDRKRLFTMYQEARDAMHPSSLSYTAAGGGRKAPAGAKLIYAVGEHEAILAITNATHEIYLALPPLVPKKTATDAAHALVRWVQKNESRFFLIGGPHF